MKSSDKCNFFHTSNYFGQPGNSFNKRPQGYRTSIALGYLNFPSIVRISGLLAQPSLTTFLELRKVGSTNGFVNAKRIDRGIKLEPDVRKGLWWCRHVVVSRSLKCNLEYTWCRRFKSLFFLPFLSLPLNNLLKPCSLDRKVNTFVQSIRTNSFSSSLFTLLFN